jgi:hypothetical protein
MTRIVAYDPFARGGLKREPAGAGECDWCGQQRRTLYTYEPERSGLLQRLRRSLGYVQSGPWRRRFCNLDCVRGFVGR